MTFFEVMSSIWYACGRMKRDVVLLAGSEFTHGHWIGINAICMVKLMLMLMVDKLLGIPSGEVAP